MWDHPNPIFVDFETQSACDLREKGGRLYVEHPSTRVLMLVAAIDDTFHVWIPDHIRVETRNWQPEQLWPHQMRPKQKVRLWRGEKPWEIVANIRGRPLVAHNAYGFDRGIWERFIGPYPHWLDSLYLARINGRPGRLDAIGQQLFGQGKDRAKKLMPKLTTAYPSAEGLFGSDWRYPLIQSGDLQAFTRYAVGDVEIVRRMWAELQDTPVEADVIAANLAVNDRGVRVDLPLLATLENLSRYCVDRATDEIADLTDGRIAERNIRSTVQMHEWLGEYGVRITGNDLDDEGNKKLTLRKDAVQKFLDSPYLIDEFMVAVREVPPLVLEVLKLRMKALRITDAKVHRAQERASEDGRIRDLHNYYTARTGRFSSYGFNVHNLPKALRGIDIEEMVAVFHQHGHDVAKLYDVVQAMLVKAEPDPKRRPSVDDVNSALLRPTIIPEDGFDFDLADFSSVEGRGVAWVADEQKLLDIYRRHGDPYRTFAAMAFGIPEEQVTKEQRDGVGKVGILALSYGMGPPKLRIYAANFGVDLVKAGLTAEGLVDIYRSKFTKIAGFKPDRNSNFRTNGIWQNYDRAVKDCIAKRAEVECGKCRFFMRGSDMVIELPSGRWMRYPEARIEDVVPPYVYALGLPANPKATAVYTSDRGPKSLYGGIITENIVQAVCRDLLAAALIELERMGHRPVVHVHDEIVCEVPKKKAEKMLREQVRVMSTAPDWAEGFPVACEGFVSPRFVKKAFKGYAKLETKELEHAR